MNIRNFEDRDILEVCKISHLVWGDLYKKESLAVQKIIYNFTVEYYDLNREFSLICEDDGLKGFILAAKKEDAKDLYKKLLSQIQNNFSKNEQKVILDLYEYLDYCGKLVKAKMTSNDIMMGLFVSVQKGVGKSLLNRLSEICIAKGMKNIYLWTDTTCDYDYYKKNNFELVQEVDKIVNGRKLLTQIYKKSVEI